MARNSFNYTNPDAVPLGELKILKAADRSTSWDLQDASVSTSWETANFSGTVEKYTTGVFGFMAIDDANDETPHLWLRGNGSSANDNEKCTVMHMHAEETHQAPGNVIIGILQTILAPEGIFQYREYSAAEEIDELIFQLHGWYGCEPRMVGYESRRLKLQDDRLVGYVPSGEPPDGLTIFSRYHGIFEDMKDCKAAEFPEDEFPRSRSLRDRYKRPFMVLDGERIRHDPIRPTPEERDARRDNLAARQMIRELSMMAVSAKTWDQVIEKAARIRADVDATLKVEKDGEATVTT